MGDRDVSHRRQICKKMKVSSATKLFLLFILLLETLALPYFSDLIKFVVALMGFRSARKVLKQEIFDILERGRALHS